MSREWIIDDDFLDQETKSSADGQGYLTELVRCKDCKHFTYCENDCCLPENFCSQGEKEDE